MRKQSTVDEKKMGVVPQRNNLTAEKADNLAERKSMTVYIGDKICKVFLSYGFYFHRNDFSTFHSHSSYPEVVILIGDCEMAVGEQILKLNGTNMLVIPPRVYHKLLTVENVEVCTFFIDMDIEFAVKTLPEQIARSFFEEAERVYGTSDHSIVASYINLIMSYFLYGSNTVLTEPVDDYAFLIDTFFNLRYMEDVSLEDLAEQLHVSLTHAHRLVQKHTGVTFTEELTARRLKVASYLVKFRAMTLSEAAEAVGFGSYTGFWRARSKYKDVCFFED